MSVESLEKLLIHDLKDLYSAEKQLLQVLPRMAKAAMEPELKQAFESHQKQTEEHVRRIEKIFEQMEGRPSGKRCKGMEGLIEEGKEILQEEMPEQIRDAALIGAAQKVEHYEMAAYGTAREFAERLGMTEAARLLQKTLEEEEETDKRLTEIAERRVNGEAQAAAAD